MINFLKKRWIRAIDNCIATIRITLYMDLVKAYGEDEANKKLAAQAVNFLTGADFLHQSNVSPEIIGIATKKALQKMDKDKEVRRLIVELNKGIISIKQEVEGANFDIEKELDNVKDVLSFYIREFPNAFSLRELEKLTTNYKKRIFSH